MKAFFKDQAVPVLLFTLLCSSTVYIYAHSDLSVVAGFTLGSAVFGALLFAFCDVLRRLKKSLISAVAIFFVFFILSMLAGMLVQTDYSTTIQWTLEPSNINQIYPGNIAALLLVFGFVLGCSLFYFTTVHYRSVFVFLICMCPFSLFAKTFTEIPVIYIILISTLFFVLMIFKASGEAVFSGKRSYIAFGLFVTVVASAAAFLPKLSSAPYREDFDELITGIQIGVAGKADFNSFSDTSSYTTSKDDTVVFTIRGDNPGRIKRQCFNLYDAKTAQWSYYGDANMGHNNWSAYMNWEDPTLLSGSYGGTSQKRAALIHSNQGRLRALYTVENMTDIAVQRNKQSAIYRTALDEFFLPGESIESADYRIEWCEFPYDDGFSVFYDYNEAVGNSVNEYGSGYYKTLTEVNDLYSYLLSADVRRSCYKSDEDYARISELAASVTAGCQTDYEKAKAIEQFFLSRRFVYDDSFSTTDPSPENFIFNTRRGVCSDYATAMALLCREAGLMSRYVEGFLVKNLDENTEAFTVSAADSHAYVQVWLNGYGWTDFDPTSMNTDNGYFDYTFLIFGGIVLLAGGLIFGVLLTIPVMRQAGFTRRAAKTRGSEQVMLLFPQLNVLLHEKLGERKLVCTIRELKERTLQKYGIDISQIADEYERAAYGGKQAADRDYLAIYRDVIHGVRTAEKEKRRAEKANKKRVKH